MRSAFIFVGISNKIIVLYLPNTRNRFNKSLFHERVALTVLFLRFDGRKPFLEKPYKAV